MRGMRRAALYTPPERILRVAAAVLITHMQPARDFSTWPGRPFANAAKYMRRRSPGSPRLPRCESEFRPQRRHAGGDIANPTHSDSRDVDSGLGDARAPRTHVSQRRWQPASSPASGIGRKGKAVGPPPTHPPTHQPPTPPTRPHPLPYLGDRKKMRVRAQ